MTAESNEEAQALVKAKRTLGLETHALLLTISQLVVVLFSAELDDGRTKEELLWAVGNGTEENRSIKVE